MAQAFAIDPSMRRVLAAAGNDIVPLPKVVTDILDAGVYEIEAKVPTAHGLFFVIQSEYLPEDKAVADVQKKYAKLAKWARDEGSPARFQNILVFEHEELKPLGLVEARIYFWLLSPLHEAVHGYLERLDGR